MSEPLLPPAIQQNVPVVDLKTGFMTAYFSIWLIQILNAIINQTNSNTSLIAALQATQAQIIAVQQQLVAVQQAQTGTGTSGAAQATVDVIGSPWVPGPLVNLTGVAAGNLTYPGSGPAQQNSTVVNPAGPNGTFNGAWRIQEIVSAVETTVFTGTWVAQRGRDDTGVESIAYNTSDTTGSVARTSTGAVSYRLDVQAHDVTLGDFEVDQIQLPLYVHRA